MRSKAGLLEISKPSAQRNILLIDDSPTDTECYRRYLAQDQHYNYQIWAAETGAEGLECCQKIQLDIIILDIMLPDMNGLEFLEKLQQESTSEIPVIILTGESSQEVIVAAIKTGATDYILKRKITPPGLLRAIDNAIQQTTLKNQIKTAQKQRQLVSNLAIKICQSVNIQEILQTSVNEIREFIKCDRVIVYQFLSDMSGKCVAESIAHGWISLLEIQLEDECFQQNQANYCYGKRQRINNIYEAGLTDCHILMLEQFQVKSSLVVPILLTNQEQSETTNTASPQLWGLLIAHQCSDFRNWQQFELELLEEIAVKAAIAIQKAQLYQDLQTLNIQLENKVKERTAQLKESEQKFKAIFNNTFQFTSLLNTDGILLEANQTALDFGGLTPDEVINYPLWETHWWETSKETQGQLKVAIARAASGEFVRSEVDILGTDGKTATIDFSLRPLQDETGQVVLLIQEGRDISDRVKTERALQESQILLQSVLDTIPERVFWKDRNSKFIGCNHQLAIDAGLSGVKEIIGKTDLDFPWKQYAPLYEKDDREIIASGQPKLDIEEPLTKAGGISCWLRTNKLPLRNADGEIIGVIGSYEDITERRQAEIALRESRCRLKLINHLLKNIATGTSVNEIISNTVSKISKYFREFRVAYLTFNSFGKLQVTHSLQPPEIGSLAGMEADSNTISEYLSRLSTNKYLAIEDINQNQQPTPWVEIMLATNTVACLDVALQYSEQLVGIICIDAAQPHHWSQNEISTLIEVANYLTIAICNAKNEQKRQEAETALRRSEEKYRLLVDNYPNGFTLMFDRDLRYLLVGGLGLAEVGLSKEKLEGKTIWEALPAETCEQIEPLYRQTLAGEEIVTEIAFANRLYNAFFLPIRESSGNINTAIVLTQDITEKKKASEKLQQLLEELEARVEQRTEALAQANAKLHQEVIQRIRLLNILEASLNEIYIFDAETLQFEYANQRALQNLGYTLEQLKQLTALDIKPELSEGELQILVNPLFNYQQEQIVLETLNHRSDGSVYPLEIHIQLIQDQDKPLFLAIAIDITERQKTQQQLQMVECALNNCEDRAILIASDGQIIYINKAGYESLGYSHQEMLNLKIWQIDAIVSDRLEWETLRENIKQQKSICLESTHHTKTGQEIPVEITASYIKFQNQEYVCGIARDITKRKQAEAERQKLVTLVENSIDFIGISNYSTGQVEYLNQAALELVGLSSDTDITSLNISDFYNPEINQYVQTEILPHLKQGEYWQGEILIRHFQTQENIPVLKSAFPIKNPKTGEIIALAAIFRDVRERKHYEEALRESEQTFRGIFDQVAVGIAKTSPTGHFLQVNERFCQIIGYDQAELVNLRFLDITHPDDSAVDAEKMHQLLNQELDIFCRQKRYIRKNGEIIWADLTVSKICFPTGEVKYCIAVIQDITQNKQAEFALAQSEKRYRQIVETAQEGIWLIDAQAKTTYCNPQMANMLGYTVEEMLGSYLYDFMDEAARIQAEENMRRRHAGIKEDHDFRFTRKDGSTLWTIVSTTPMMDETGQFIGALGMIADITQRKEAEASLQQRDAYLTALVEIQQRLLAIPNSDSIYDCVLEILGRVTNVSKVYVFENGRDESNRLYMSYVAEWCNQGSIPEIDRLELKRLYYEEWFPGWAQQLAQGEIIFKKASNYTELERQILEPSALTILLFPLFVKGEFFGILGFDDCQEIPQWDEIEVSLLKATASAISMAKERELTQGELQRQLTAIEAASDGIAISNSDNHYIYLNRAHIELFGYQEAREILGQSWKLLYKSSEISPIEQEVVPKLLQLGYCRSEAIAKRKDGSYFPLEFSLTLTAGGKVVCVCRDITERKKFEADLLETNAQLERATRLKDEFLANMSHELRTPLNAILGLSEALQEKVYGELNSQQLRLLSTIQNSGNHLLDLINDILDLSKIEAGKMELNLGVVDVEPLCKSSFSLVKELAKKKNIQLSLSFPPPKVKVEVDERRIRQVLVNLLSNAVKFTDEGGKVFLKVETNSAESTLKFSVIDTGIGIAAEDMQRLFQPFVQIDSSLSRRYSGTGLGLSLVRRITEMHGGSVSTESEVGKGSTFIVTVPWQPQPGFLRQEQQATGNRQQEASVSQIGQQESPTTPPLILVAEDNMVNAETVAAYLTQRGYQIILAKNGVEAVELASLRLPQLILIDIQMPEMDGLEATRQIRALPETANIPIIAFTALAMVGDRERCLAAGANDYITKPIHLKMLVEKIRHLQ